MKMKMLLAGLACAMLASSAQAACKDPPKQGVDWHQCTKQGASLGGADLRNAKLQGTDLTGANLQGANLSGAKLQSTEDLPPADLTGANLQGANLSGANLGDAIVSKSTLWTSGKPCKGSTVSSCN